MSFQHAVGSFALRSGTGTQDVTSVGFQPKIVLFFTSATGSDRDDYAIYSIGLDDGVTAYGRGVETKQGATPPQQTTSEALSGASIIRVASGGVLYDSILHAHIDSMLADGFRISVTKNTLSQNEVIKYVAFGGADLEYQIFTFAPQAVSVQSITGLSLAPKAVIGFFPGTLTGFGTGWAQGLTFISPTNATTLWTRDTSTTPTAINDRYLRNGYAFAQHGVREANAVDLTADGMDIHWSTHGASAELYACLALGGCVQDAACGVFTAPTSPGTQVISTPAINPAVVLFGTVGAVASTTSTTGARISIGAADADNTGVATWAGCAYGGASAVAAKGSTDARCVYVASPANPGSSSAHNALASLNALAADSFTLDHLTIGSPIAVECMYLALGTAPAIPIVAPPTPSDNPCQIATPLYWAAVQPSAELGDVLQGAQTHLLDPATYYGGDKPPLILGISNITRAASDFLTGVLPAQSASVVWADTRRFLRNIFGTVRGDFTSSPIWIYLISNTQRLLQGIPRLLFYGFLSEDPASENLTYTTTANDLVGKDYSLLGDEVLIPKRTISIDDFPNCPDTTLGGGVPIIGGTVSNADLAASDASIAGALKLIDCGDFVCEDTVTRRALLVCGHAVAGLTLFQAGAEIPADDYGINAWAPGETGWTDIVPGNQPYVTINSQWFTLVFVTNKRAKAIDADTAAYETATVASATSNVSFTVGAGESAQFTVGDDIDIRLAANSNEPELRKIASIGTDDTITITEALSGTPAAGDTVQPAALAIPDGSDAFVRADVEGMTTVAGGTGDLMEDLLMLDRHVLENFILGDYTSGNWLDPPTFEFYPGGDISYLLDRDSWDTASAVGVRYISGSPAAYFKGSFVIGAGGRRQSTRQVMADFARSGNVLRAWRGNNQLCVRMFDRDRSNFLGGRATITDRLNILSQPRFAPTPMKEWLCNDLTFRYRQNYREDNHGDWWESGNHGNAPSKERYGTQAMVEFYPMVADADTADAVALERIGLLADMPTVWTWGESLCGLTHDMLDGIAITHYGGKSNEGFVDTAMWIIKQTIDPKNSRVIYQAIEVDRLLGGT